MILFILKCSVLLVSKLYHHARASPVVSPYLGPLRRQSIIRTPSLMTIFRFVKTVKRAFDNKIISSCDIKLGAVVSFVFIFRGAESGVAVSVAARPTILHLVCRLFRVANSVMQKEE